MSEKNTLLLGFTIQDKSAKNIFSADPLPAIQTHKFAWSLARSLESKFNKIILASFCPIQNYPIAKRIFFSNLKFKKEEIIGYEMFFINLLILKHVTRIFSSLINIPIIIIKHKIDTIFIHGLHTPHLITGFFCSIAKKKVFIVITDPPGVRLKSDSLIEITLKKIDSAFARLLIKKSSGIISVSESLATNLAPLKPTLLIPGILNSETEKIIKKFSTATIKNNFNVVYAGGLTEEYGIKILIESMELIKDQDINLTIFGKGDMADKVKNASKNDRRIIYGGFVNEEILMPELINADLLINPRPSNNTVAIQSFPSKLIEYLATGTPTLTTKIKSIPPSYINHFYIIEDESPSGVANSILSIKSIEKEERLKHGKKAQEFISSIASENSTGSLIAKFTESIQFS